tara:strand:- start:433 stop:858 length:426 start_codon:yes stop_codon:yes gene_type:complete
MFNARNTPALANAKQQYNGKIYQRLLQLMNDAPTELEGYSQCFEYLKRSLRTSAHGRLADEWGQIDWDKETVQTIDGAWAIKQALNHTIRFSECPAADGWWTPQMLVECAIEDGVLEVSFDADFLRCVDIAQNLLPEPSNW